MQARLFMPDERAQASLDACWSTHFPAGAKLIGCSGFGDAFLVAPSGEVLWLNTGTAECSMVAASQAQFEQALATEAADDWFLPALVRALESEGKVLAPGQCYTYAILPVFAEGKFEPWNFRAVPAWEHFEVTAAVHRQIEGMPEGARLRLHVK